MKVKVNDAEREQEILDKLNTDEYKNYENPITEIYKEIFKQMKDLESGEE